MKEFPAAAYCDKTSSNSMKLPEIWKRIKHSISFIPQWNIPNHKNNFGISKVILGKKRKTGKSVIPDRKYATNLPFNDKAVQLAPFSLAPIAADKYWHGGFEYWDGTLARSA